MQDMTVWFHPFDAWRHLHDAALRAGGLRRSLVEAGRFEQWLHALEVMWLGPLARSR